ncbi:hypothetical protein AKO1_004081 [Acrasis kona]|uniref:Uncharacterized protein n=1 Tax=Acrasis kona TaxID=1008807 RepID=A0AAW2YTZ9_9EUKA
MHKGDLQFIRDNVIPAGVAVYSDMDLPGLTDYHINNQSDWFTMLDDIFGIKPTQANAYEYPVVEYSFVDPVAELQVNVMKDLSPQIDQGSAFWVGVFKYHKVEVTSGDVVATYNIQLPAANIDNKQYPAVIFKNRTQGLGRSLLATFNLGSIDCSWPCFTRTWIQHWNWYYQLLSPAYLNVQNELTYMGSTMMQVQHYTTSDGRIVIYATNWNYEASESCVVSMDRLKGLQITDILTHKLITPSCNGQLQISLGISGTLMYVAEKAPKPSVYISTYGTPTDLVIKHSYTSVNVTYRTSAYNNARLVIELRNNATDNVYGSASINSVNGDGTNLLQMFMDSSLITKSSEVDNVKYYYYAYLTSGQSNEVIASTTIDLRISVGIKLSSSPKISVNQTAQSTVSWEHTGLLRQQAFPTLLGVYFSNETQKVDPTHYNKVQLVVNQLQKMGFVENTDVSDPMNSNLVLKGLQYSVITNLTQIGTNQQGLWYGVVILPGVSVLTDNDTACINNFLNSTQNGILISTEGGVGSGNNSRNLQEASNWFGMDVDVSDSQSNQLVDVTITNVNNPTLRNFTMGDVISVRSGKIWSKLTTGKSYATSKNGTPMMVYNQLPNRLAKTVLLNFDITQSPNGTQLWDGLVEYSYLENEILKLKWQLMCGDVIQSASDDEIWIYKSSGISSFEVIANALCHNTSTWLGYSYPWDSSSPFNDRVAELNVQTNFPGSGLPPDLSYIKSGSNVAFSLIGASVAVSIAVVLSIII